MKRTTVSERALVLAPRGRDAAIAAAMLGEAGIAAAPCASLPHLVEELDNGAGLVVLTEEALATADLAPLSAWIADQQKWSDLPFVLLTSHGGGIERNPAARRYLDVLGNATFIERPFHPTTLISLAQAALRGRRRQYEARARMEALRTSEQRFRAVQDTSIDGFMVLESLRDEERRVIDFRWAFANKAAERIVGKPREWFIGRRLLEEMPGHREDGLFGNYVRVVETGEPWTGEFAYGHEGVDAFIRLVAAKAGDGLAVSFADLSERRRAEEALRESEERLRLATENAEVGFWDVDMVNDVLVWPPRVKAMFGISPDVPVTMRDFHEGLHPEDRGATGDAFAAASDPARRALYDIEYRTVGKEDGLVRWVAAKGRGTFDEGGRCIRVVGTAIEVTKRKEIEERIRELNETLERRVEEEVAERAKTEEQLRQAQKMEAVGQLTGGIAHDFNNLLTGVIGSLDMMQRRIAKGETDRIERYATSAMTSANRAAALTHRLLAFSRRQPLDPKPVDANRLVAGMEELLRRTIGEAIRLEIVTAGGLWQTLCDPHQLESAVLNLVINARDAMPDGGKLTIETFNASLDDAYAARSRGVKPGQYICICVTDTGTGMSIDVIAKAFDPFFTTKPIGQGTGLGLSMIYGFARQSEGYAKIHSEVGEGTTVKLYLPRYDGAAEERDEQQGQSGAHRAAHGEVVLVVEDETAVRNLVVDVLQELGYSAVEAADGPSGLKLLQSDMRIDLLVTDVGLPGLNGRQLADQARERRPDLKVLFMTGYAENAAVANGFLEPGMQLITKPFAIDVLTARMRDMIEQG